MECIEEGVEAFLGDAEAPPDRPELFPRQAQERAQAVRATQAGQSVGWRSHTPTEHRAASGGAQEPGRRGCVERGQARHKVRRGPKSIPVLVLLFARALVALVALVAPLKCLAALAL